MSDLTINDLRVAREGQLVARRKLRGGDTRPLTPAEFDQIARGLGYVKREDVFNEIAAGARREMGEEK